ncbi:MAG: BNR-4 repeat-containing protein [Salinibacterium sp.]|nr:BNR-4 repeat-containing protein [Salinibacterium sp.]
MTKHPAPVGRIRIALGTVIVVGLLAAPLTPAAAVELSASSASPIPAPAAIRQGDWILDATARGVLSYQGTTSIGSFQQDGLITHAGYQYVGWYRSDKQVAISRRALPSGPWQSIELPQKLDIDDSHNVINMAVSPADGRLHIAIGTHGGAVRYVRSVPGLASEPDAATWSKSSFSAEFASMPGATGASSRWTYPQFELVEGRLMLTYREGNTSDGRNLLLRYNEDAAGTWTFLGQYTGSTGTYTSPFGASNSRYAYLHGFSANPVSGDIEIAFSWREQASAWCDSRGLGNHDIGYARSSDGGATWVNNAGARIGVTGSDQISITDDHVAVPISINRGLINQEAQGFDGAGRLHVMTSQFNDADLASIGGCHTSTYAQRSQLAKPFHHWRDADGVWQSFELPFYSQSAGRTKILFDRFDTAYVVLPDGRIAAATAAASWSDWRLVFDAPDVENIAELIVDRSRLLSEGVLSVAYQETSLNNTPSAFRVADFSTDPTAIAQPKNTRAEEQPVPVDGIRDATATATSSQPGYGPELAIDRSGSTFWVSGGTLDGDGPQPARPEVLTIDYGSPRTISEVTVTPRFSDVGPRRYSIEARVGSTWVALKEVDQAATPGPHVHGVEPTRTDAIRLVITAAWDRTRTPETARNVQIAEVAATVVSDVVATATSSQPGYPPAFAVDQDSSTFWVSAGTMDGQGPQPARPEILTMTYAATQVVREVTVAPRRADIGPRAFAIEALIGSNWVVLARVTAAATATPKSYSVPPTKTKAIRLVITSAWDAGRTPERTRNVQVAEVSLTSPDDVAPASESTAPVVSASTEFAVAWTASDAEPATGVTMVDLFVKGPRDVQFVRVDRQEGTSSGSFAYEATQGDGEYASYTIATDLAGLIEAPPEAQDAITLVDTVAPVVQSGVAERTVSLTGSDAGSGIAALEYRLDDGVWAPYVDVIAIDAAAHRFQFRAVDTAGNMSEVGVLDFVELWGFGGFQGAVLDAPEFTRANAGRAIPLSFTIGGDRGMEIFAKGSPATQPIDCETGEILGEPENLESAREPLLTFDPDTGVYTVVWRTDHAWAGTCRMVSMSLGDGSTHRALFRF